MSKAEKILGLGVLIAIVIAVGGFFHSSPKEQVVRGVASTPTTDNQNNTNFTSVNSIGGVFIANRVADVYSWVNVPTSLSTATNTICAIQSPAASTTLDSLVVNFTGSTTALTLVAGTSTTPYGTSSTPFLTNQTIAASIPGTVSIYGGTNNTIVGPSQYITVGANGSGFSTGYYFPAGTCTAVFRTVGPN